MENEREYHDNEVINKWVKTSIAMVNKATLERQSLTQDELEDLRLEISSARMMMVTEVLDLASNEKIASEMAMDDQEGRTFVKMLHSYTNKKLKQEKKDKDGEVVKDKDGKPVMVDVLDTKGQSKRLYTASTAESIARKAMKTKSTTFYKKKEKWMKAKAFEQVVFQLLKSMDGVANALSAVSKH